MFCHCIVIIASTVNYSGPKGEIWRNIKRLLDGNMIVLTLAFGNSFLFKTFMCVVIVFVARIKRASHEIFCK